MTQHESSGSPTSSRSKKELAWRTERNEGHNRIGDLGRDAIAVPSDAVGAVAVQIDSNRVETHVVVRGQGCTSNVEPFVLGGSLFVEPSPGREARLMNDLVVHPSASLAPCDISKELLECQIGAGHPVRAVVQPGGIVEMDSINATEGWIDRRGPISPQRRLPVKCTRVTARTMHKVGCTRITRPGDQAPSRPGFEVRFRGGFRRR